MYIFLDTETTGVDPKARMVSVAAQLDIDGEPAVFCHHLIQPAEEIPASATAIHGITTQVALDFGIPLEQALHSIAYIFTSGRSAKLVGHNLEYDRRVLAYDAAQGGHVLSWPQSNFCTMRALSIYVHSNKKWPKLEEAYRWMFGRLPSNPHSAQHDMLACRAIFYEGQRRGLWA